MLRLPKLKRLLRRLELTPDQPPASASAWSEFLRAAEELLEEEQRKREVFEHTLAVSTAEMERLYDELKISSRARLENQRAFLQIVVDSLPVALYCKDISADIENKPARDHSPFSLWNRQLETLTGIRAADILGRNTAQISPAPTAASLERLDTTTLPADGSIATAEETLTSAAGEAIPVRVHQVVIYDANRQPLHLVAILEDLRPAKALAEQLEAHRANLAQSSKLSALGEMAGGIAHEINNPITIIYLHAQKISKLLKNQPEKITEAADIIAQTAQRVAHIVKSMRLIAREGSHDPFEKTSVQALIADTLSLCQERIRSAGVELRVDEIGAEVTTECRRVEIGQVLLNLLNNAFDACAESQAPWIEIQVRKLAGQRIAIRIRDSGPGVPAELREKILQPFFTTKGVGKGTGLGLSISLGILTKHQGTLYYDGQDPASTFVVELPISQSLASPPQENTPARAA